LDRRLILIVDDDDAMRELITLVLAQYCSAEVLTFGSGPEALRDLHSASLRPASGSGAQPCLVILDLEMPGMGGLEVLAAIRHDPGTWAVPVMVFSSMPKPEQIAACLRAGANAVVRKSVHFDELQRRLQLACDYWLETNERVRA